MADKKMLAASLDKVGTLISKAQSFKTKLSSAEVTEAKRTLGTAATELFVMRANARKASVELSNKREAVKKSMGEKLITTADAQKELKNIVIASAGKNSALRNIDASIDAIKKLSSELSKLSSTPELEQLDKGAKDDAAIKEPQSATGSKRVMSAAMRKQIMDRIAMRRKKATENVDDQLMGDGKVVPELKVDELGLKPQDSDPVSQGNAVVLEEGSPADNGSKGDATGDALAEDMVTARKKAQAMLLRAAKLVEESEKEKDAAKKSATLRKAAMFERIADNLMVKKTASKVEPRPAFAKTATNATVKKTFSANEKVLLVDGSVATVKSANGNNLMVSVAGVIKNVLASTVKKISSAPAAPVKTTATVGNSIADRISSALSFVRGSKKVKADNEDVLPAVVPGTELEKPKDASGAGATVQTNDSKAVSFNQDLNKWVVVISENEVVAFDDEDSAKGFVAAASKKTATADNMMDSANVTAPASQEEVQDALKGLDQSAKDGGATTKDQQVDPQQGPVGNNSTASIRNRIATALNPKLPTDSSTDKPSSATESIVSKIKGLTQDNKGYTSTTKEQQIDPKLGPIKEASIQKVRILEAANQRLIASLSVSEGKLMADRAVKVGAIVEAQRADQEIVLAELYQNAPSEFKAYARLLSNLETTAANTPTTIANRNVRKVEASLAQRKSTLVDGVSSNGTSGSLDSGNFFD